MDASHEPWRDDPDSETEPAEEEAEPSAAGDPDLGSSSEDDFYVLLDFDEADAAVGGSESGPAAAFASAPDEPAHAMAGAAAPGAEDGGAGGSEEPAADWMLRGPDEVAAANAEPFELNPEIPPEILAAGTPRAGLYGSGHGERRLRKLFAVGSLGAGALLLLSAGLVYMKRIATAPRPSKSPTQSEAPLVARGPEARTPRPPRPAVRPGSTAAVEPATPVPTALEPATDPETATAPDPPTPGTPVSPAPRTPTVVPDPSVPDPVAAGPVEPAHPGLDPSFRFEDPDRPRIRMSDTPPESVPAPHLPESADPVSVRTPEGGFILLKAGQVLVALRNGNHFVGRIYRINLNELVLRVPTGEIVLATRYLSRIVPLVGAKEPGIESMPDGYVELRNGNRIWGKILEESDDVVAIGFASAKITIPRAAVSAVGHGAGTSIEFVGN